MTVDQMRCALCDQYTGPKWRLKVQAMPDRQVVAIYKNMEAKGRFTQKKKRKRKEPSPMTNVQLTIFDVLYGNTPRE